MKWIRMITKTLFAVFVLAVFGGCTQIQTVSLQPSPLPPGQVLSHHVVLVLNQELADYKHVYHEEGITIVYPFGVSLQNYARQVVSKSFPQVDVVPSMEEAVGLTSADLILIPRALKSDISIPVY